MAVFATEESNRMKIIKASVHDFEWKREQPITNGRHTYDKSDLTIVEIETDSGITGYGMGRPRPGERDYREFFLSKIVGRNPLMTEAIWADLWSPKLYGRRGSETRALASIDLALWDVKAKAANLPLHQLLGGYRDEVPFYIAGGYYADGKGLQELQSEVESYVALGSRGVKIKVGALSITDDVARVRAVRQAIGDGVELLLDANCAYRAAEAIQFAKRVEDYRPYWFEEPVQPDHYQGFVAIGNATWIPLASGENEYTKYGFRDLIATGAIGMLNPDARYTGGVTEFMKIAALAQAHDLAISPHGDQQAHLPLVAAIPNSALLEFYPTQVKEMASASFLNPIEMTDHGTVLVSSQPGAGMDPAWSALEHHRINKAEFV
jgi:L-alanine-DL-glutamate epimerase-like enolase superfamily enzyme